MLTFGGAYAVLPYVYQGAVNHYAWLGPTQMIDGLALGRKLLKTTDYGGGICWFLGGFNHALLGSEHLFLAGAIGAVIVTWFTFLFFFCLYLAGTTVY